MKRAGRGLDLMLYLQAFPVYARNLGVMLFPLIGAAIGIGIGYFGSWFSEPTGGATMGIFNLITQLVLGFVFAVAVIFADDAWRHNRASISAAWSTARRKAGDILVTVLGFYFLIYVAQLIGNGILGGVFRIPYAGLILAAIAAWAFIYSIPAAAMGGVPAGGSFSVSLQTARRYPLPTAILTIVSVVVYYYLALIVPTQIGAYLGPGYDVARLLLQAFAIGYIALIVSRQYQECAFRGGWY